MLQAAWPNAAFDLCGICCGHFQMSFWQFFGATFIGKALIKVGMCAGHGRLVFLWRHERRSSICVVVYSHIDLCRCKRSCTSTKGICRCHR